MNRNEPLKTCINNQRGLKYVVGTKEFTYKTMKLSKTAQSD